MEKKIFAGMQGLRDHHSHNPYEEKFPEKSLSSRRRKGGRRRRSKQKLLKEGNRKGVNGRHSTLQCIRLIEMDND